VGQHLNGSDGPFGKRPVQAFLLDAAGKTTQLGRISKPLLARAILDKIERVCYVGSTL